MAWLLDTNILSELRRPRPEPKVLSFVETLSFDEMYVSVATMFEQRVVPITEKARVPVINPWEQ